MKAIKKGGLKAIEKGGLKAIEKGGLKAIEIALVQSNLTCEVPCRLRDALGIDTTQEKGHAWGQPGAGCERTVDTLSQ